jgi:Imm-5 like putative immunity protein
MKINAEWHARHRMPKNPTLDQRVKWHIDHARNCACRPLSGNILEEVRKRTLGTHQEFWVFFTRQDLFDLADWAAGCAERVLPLFIEKYPQDARPEAAIRTLRQWIATGHFSMPVIRGASLAAHTAAREVHTKDLAASYAARAAGQAVATAHVPTHAFGAALYALKAIAARHPGDEITATAAERAWQVEHIPDHLRDWVTSGLKAKQAILPRELRA